MKKSLLVTLFLIIVISASSQEYMKALGIRVGSAAGVSCKIFLKSDQAIQGILDLDIIKKDKIKIKTTGAYLFHFNVDVDGLSLFAGPGVSAGIYLVKPSGFMMSLDGMLGIEYKFQQSPIVLAIDWNPKIQMIKDPGFKSNNFGVTLGFIF